MADNFSDTVIKNSHSLIDYLRIFPEIVAEQREKMDDFVRLILSGGKSIHVFGVGRSGAVALCFAIRLKHFEKVLNHKVWWLGDEVREKINREDVLVVFSGSGETTEAVFIARKAKEVGARITTITSYPDSTLGKMSDLVILLPGGLEKARGWRYLEAQVSDSPFYGAGEFELMAYLLQEVLIMSIGEYYGIEKRTVVKEHVRDS